MNLFKILWIIFLILTLSKTIRSQTDCNNDYGNQIYKGTCKSVDECIGAALKGNCLNSYVCCISDKKAPNIPENSFISKSLFLKLAGDTPRNKELYNYFVESLSDSQIYNQYRAAAYFSTLVGETNYFKELESKVADPDFNTDLGNNETTDGSKFRGRGAIWLRGKTNYILANSKLSSSLGVNFLLNPEKVAFPSYAFKVAAWFWRENAFIILSDQKAVKGSLNDLVDGTFHNFTLLTHALTNDLTKLKERANFNELVLKEMKYPSMKRGRGIECKISSETQVGYAIPICLSDFKKPYCGCEGIFDMKSCPYGLSGTKCRSSSVIKCCVEKCNKQLDLVVLMDSSGSIGAENFIKMQEFVIQVFKNLELGSLKTRVSLINFNSDPFEIFNFLNFVDFNAVEKLIKGIMYNGGGTDTAAALKMANELVLQENKGMRPENQGVPKIIIVVTDGESNDNAATLLEANNLKNRGFSIVSIGIGNLKEEELIDMASSPNDVYKVEDFDKVLLILSSVSLTACQQPATVTEEKGIKSDVGKDSYKYFRHSLENKPENFTIEVTDLKGETEFYYSFEDENPKSPDEFINENTTQSDDFDFNFIEKNSVSKYTSSFNSKATFRATDNKKSFVIRRPITDNNTGFLYIGIKGIMQANEFQLQVYDKVIKPSEPFNPTTLLIIIIVILFVLLIITITSLVVVLTTRKKKMEKKYGVKNDKSNIEMKKVGKNWQQVIF